MSKSAFRSVPLIRYNSNTFLFESTESELHSENRSMPQTPKTPKTTILSNQPQYHQLKRSDKLYERLLDGENSFPLDPYYLSNPINQQQHQQVSSKKEQKYAKQLSSISVTPNGISQLLQHSNGNNQLNQNFQIDFHQSKLFFFLF